MQADDVATSSENSARVAQQEAEIIDGEVIEDAAVETQLALLDAPLQLIVDGEPVDPISEMLGNMTARHTIRNYRSDYKDFFAFLGGDVTPGHVGQFLALPRRDIALLLSRYQGHLIQRGLREATIARRIAAVRSLLNFAYRHEWAVTDGRNLVDVKRVRSYRDTRGVEISVLKKLCDAPAKRFGEGTLHALRDAAIFNLLCKNGLRRSEVCKLDVGDFFLSDRRLAITGKGRGSQKEIISLGTPTASSIAAYLLAAGHANEKGALFRNLHRGEGIRDKRLTGDGLYFLICEYGKYIGTPELRPHKLRHAAITALALATNGNLNKVKEFSRHTKLETVDIYVANAEDTQGQMTDLLEDLISGKTKLKTNRRK